VTDAWNDSGACEVVLARGDEREAARLRWWARWGKHRIELRGPVGAFSGSGPDQFEALVELRRTLDETGWRIAVQGARRDAFPSGMTRDMRQGMQVYVLIPGPPAKTTDLVDTLAPAKVDDVGTVDEQRNNWKNWLRD
jgi:hypothetical protein